MLEEAGGAVDLVQGNQDLAVAVALEAVVVLLDTSLSDGIVVVDFSVHHGVDLAIVTV